MLRQNVPQSLYTLTVSGTSSTATTGSSIFTIGNYDFNTIVAKISDTTFAASGGSAPTLSVYLQTSDDGGITFYDLVHFGSLTTLGTGNLSQMAVIGSLKETNTFIGTPLSLGIGAQAVSAMPLLGRTMRAVYTYGSANGAQIGSTNLVIQLLAVDQDFR